MYDKVCLRIPDEEKEELLQIAKLRRDNVRSPGWDAKLIHQIARDHFGGLEKMYQHHGWDERGSDMMRYVQKHVKQTYGSVDAFAEKFGHEL